MKLTKYKHACFTLEIDGELLVVDPGELSTDFDVTSNILAVVVTHEHTDHFSTDNLAAIFAKNPDSLLLSTSEVIAKMPNHNSQIVIPGEQVDVGPFHLDFYGGTHATVHTSIPVIDNIAIMINNTLYYPGDSFYQPAIAVDTLAVPLGAPWLKTSESIDFLVSLKPRLAFPTHDETLSIDGKGFANRLITHFANENEIKYSDIHGIPIEL